jgi:hypothetical protein
MSAAITNNNGVRHWVSDLLASGLSAATTRKAVFALRQCLTAVIAEADLHGPQHARDREGSFELVIVVKRQRQLSSIDEIVPVLAGGVDRPAQARCR